MAVNSIFHTNNKSSILSERNLYKDLIKEAIQIYGHDVYYVNRTTVALDNVLGEDSLSKFTTQHPIEMYVEDAEGFGGDKEIISQFGLENRNEITFVVSKQRFQEMDSQINLEDGTDTTGGSIQLEAGSIDQSSNSSTLETVTQSFVTMNGTDSSSTNSDDKIMLENDNESFILSEESGSEFYIIMDTATTDADRPLEGDLVYHPVLAKMFEISFVDHDEPFYQLDNNPVYKLRCKQYEYSGEIIDTGITTIDEIESDLSEDTSQFQFTLEQSSAVNEDIRLEYRLDSGLVLLDGTDLDFNRITLDHSGTIENLTGGGTILLEGNGGATGSLLNENSSTSVSNNSSSDNLVGEDDSTSVGESILLENEADTGQPQYLISEDYIIGDGDTDKTIQNELFETLDDSVLDFSETNPFGDVGS